MILKLGLLNSLLFWNQALLPPFTVEKALKGVGSASDKKRKAEDSKGQALFFGRSHLRGNLVGGLEHLDYFSI